MFRTLPVLMYHHISNSPDMITTTPENFDSQLAWLAKAGFTTLGADGVAAFLAGEPVPEKSVVLTFDDGFLDNWVYAHPLLQCYGMKALLFAITGQIGDGPVRPFAGQGLGLPATPGHRACEAAVEAGEADSVMLRWSEIEAMQAAGTFEIHSHTHTHTRWDKKFANDPQAKREGIATDLGRSVRTLTRRLGSVSSHLCWPQGYFDADYVAEAQALGFRYLYTTDPKGQNQPGDRPDHIRRIAVKDEPGPWLRRRLFLSRHRVLGPWYDRVRYRR